jgi:hypothetical protein
VRGILKVLGLLGLAVGVLAYPLAFAVDRAAGREVLIVTAWESEVVELNRSLWDGTKKEVPGIYGTPTGEPVRLVGPPAGKLLQPEEDPSVTLYLKRGDDHPLQAQTLWYFALPATVAGLVAGALLLLVGSRMGRRAGG